jgi:hypothetical protein
MRAAKNSGVARRVVISQVVALAPSSQNSKGCGFAGFAQEQLTHANPSGLFWRSSTRLPLTGTCSPVRLRRTDPTDPQPPAGAVSVVNFGLRAILVP